MLQILSICFFIQDSQALLQTTSIILRQFFWEGARKMRHFRSPMYLVQFGKLEYSSKSKFMSRFTVLTIAKPQVYFFWYMTKRPEQFSCHQSPQIWMKSLVLVTKSTDLLSFQNLHCSYFSSRGSIFMKKNALKCNDYKFKNRQFYDLQQDILSRFQLQCQITISQPLQQVERSLSQNSYRKQLGEFIMIFLLRLL